MDENEQPFVDLDSLQIPHAVLKIVSPAMAQVYRVVPIRFENNTLTVAMADATNVNTLDDLAFMLNCDVSGVPAEEKKVAAAIERYYTANERELMELANSPDEMGALTSFLLKAIQNRVSLVVLQISADAFEVFIDGKLERALHDSDASAICARIKSMANIDIPVTTVSQSGIIILKVGDQPVELQVTTCPMTSGESPVTSGESITIRLRYLNE